MGYFDIPTLGEAVIPSPLNLSAAYGDYVSNYVSDNQKVRFSICAEGELVDDEEGVIDQANTQEVLNSSLEVAGPRQKIFFAPKKISCAIVTCGGLCPGLNNVIRSIVMELYYMYGVTRILGIRYGFAGLNPAFKFDPIQLTPEFVSEIHDHGGTILGSSRGNQPISIMVDDLERLGIDMLFCIGGDGTQKGTYEIYEEVTRRGLKIAIIGIPKTIDNDIHMVEKSFGFETAFSKAVESIRSAHTEAIGAWNGIGLVKLMGRNSGYVAAYAALALNEVNFVLVPEVPFDLLGSHGFLSILENRLEKRHHAVIVVAEGAGQEYFSKNNRTDSSGNKKLDDIGLFLKNEIEMYLKGKGIPFSMRYIDPSYIIRSVPAVPSDTVFCSQLGRNAVHAGMAGKTGMLVGWRKNIFVHIPLAQVITKRKTLNPDSQFWFSVIGATGQPVLMLNNPRLY